VTIVTCADGTKYDVDTIDGVIYVLERLGCRCGPADTLRSSSGAVTPPGWLPTIDDRSVTTFADGIRRTRRTITCSGCQTQFVLGDEP
jgi:hypothetical protein